MKGVRTLALVAAAAACLFLLHVARARQPSALDAVLAAPPIPARVARLLSFGFSSAVADVTYLQAIQVFGERAHPGATPLEVARRGLGVYRLLDYTTDLDPAFNYAYIFGAVAIPTGNLETQPLNLDEALALLEKGMREGGPDWRIPFHIGYIRSEFHFDFAGAAEAMAEAARRPRRPDWVPLLATRLAAQGGSVHTGIALARAMVQQAQDDEQRAEFEHRLRLLEMERDCLAIEAAARRFGEARGRPPAALDELVAAGLLPEAPVEPHGGRYEYDPATGKARSSAAERLRIGPRAWKIMNDQMERWSRDRAAAREVAPR